MRDYTAQGMDQAALSRRVRAMNAEAFTSVQFKRQLVKAGMCTIWIVNAEAANLEIRG